MNVQITLNKLSHTTGSNCTLHLTFPEENVPYNSTNVLQLNETIDFVLNETTHCIAVVHIYNYDNTKLMERFLFQPTFNSMNSVNMNNHVLTYEITFTSEDAVPIVFKEKDIMQMKNRIESYTQMQYNMLSKYQPRRESLRLKHSLTYQLDSNMGPWNIPYVTIATRGHKVLQNIDVETWRKYENFFYKDITNFFKDVMGYKVTSVIQRP